MKTTDHHFAEYVSPGHPDRLADAIAESVVDYAVAQDDRALVGVEVAVHTNKVFVDGRVAWRPKNGGNVALPLNQLVSQVYANAGYDQLWQPNPEQIEITQDICLETLSDEESQIRSLSDDQNVVLGFATSDQRTNHLPIAHYLANRIGHFVFNQRKNSAFHLGPDFKVLPHLCVSKDAKGNESLEWQRLTLSIQHHPDYGYEQQHRLLFPTLSQLLLSLEAELHFPGLGQSFTLDKFFLNGAGDFCIGGPHGDNGLSGKKLVVDHYGPAVPIGGGALCGKDPHKIDRVGPLRARQLAKQIARAQKRDTEVRLIWSPGEASPSHIEAVVNTNGNQRVPHKQLPPSDWFNIETIFEDLKLNSVCWRDTILRGFFTNEQSAWEV